MSIGFSIVLLVAMIAIGVLHYQTVRDYKQQVAALLPEIDDLIAIYVNTNERMAQELVEEALQRLKLYNLEPTHITNEPWGRRYYFLSEQITVAFIRFTDTEEQVIRTAKATFIDNTIPVEWVAAIACANYAEHTVCMFPDKEDEDGED